MTVLAIGVGYELYFSQNELKQMASSPEYIIKIPDPASLAKTDTVKRITDFMCKCTCQRYRDFVVKVQHGIYEILFIVFPTYPTL